MIKEVYFVSRLSATMFQVFYVNEQYAYKLHVCNPSCIAEDYIIKAFEGTIAKFIFEFDNTGLSECSMMIVK